MAQRCISLDPTDPLAPEDVAALLAAATKSLRRLHDLVLAAAPYTQAEDPVGHAEVLFGLSQAGHGLLCLHDRAPF